MASIRKLPPEWIDRIFERLQCIYKEKWTSMFGSPEKERLAKIMWSSGLTGLSAEEIKKALAACECFPHYHPPVWTDFYHYAKGFKTPPRRKEELTPMGDPEIAKKYLQSIKKGLK